jgi:uncharacterized membrane protein
METWFIYAVASAIFAGLHTFTQKIAVERGYSSALVNAYSTAISATLALGVIMLFYNFNGSWKIGIALGVISGLMHMLGSVARMDSLKYIDTAIFFPLYKTAGPMFAVLLGLLIFGEAFTAREWLGIILGITVPLLLLHKSEDDRQKNLKFGLLLMLVSAMFTATSAGIAKYGVSVFETIFLFVAVSHIFGAISGWLVHVWQKKSRMYHDAKHKPMDARVILLSTLSGITQFAGFSAMMFAFLDGSLAVVYTINSFYILIPIVLSIIIYKEHWNMRKALAIALSIAALGFLR